MIFPIRAVLFATCCACLMLPVSSLAQENCPPADWADVVRLSKEAKRLLDNRQYEPALDKLRTAYAICPNPKLHRSVGKVYLAMGRDEDAIKQFQACISSELAPDVLRECETLAKRAEAVIAATTIKLVGILKNSVVLIDGEVYRGIYALPIPAKPGQHLVEVRAEGFVPFTRTVKVDRGRQTVVKVVTKLKPVPENVPESAPEPVDRELPDQTRSDQIQTDQVPVAQTDAEESRDNEPAVKPNVAPTPSKLDARRIRPSFQARLSGGLDLARAANGVSGLIQVGVGTGRWFDIHTGVGFPGYAWVTDFEANLWPHGRFIPTLAVRASLGFASDYNIYSVDVMAGVEMWATDWLAFFVKLGVGYSWNLTRDVGGVYVPAFVGAEFRY